MTVLCGKEECNTKGCGQTFSAECQVDLEDRKRLLAYGFKVGKYDTWYWDGTPDKDKGMNFQTALKMLKAFEDLEKQTKL